jgi:hypothetical protein
VQYTAGDFDPQDNTGKSARFHIYNDSNTQSIINATEATNAHESAADKFNDLGSGAKAGVIVGIVAGVFLITTISYFCCCRGCCCGCRGRPREEGPEVGSEMGDRSRFVKPEFDTNALTVPKEQQNKQELPLKATQVEHVHAGGDGLQIPQEEGTAPTATPTPPSTVYDPTSIPTTPAPAYSPLRPAMEHEQAYFRQ